MIVINNFYAYKDKAVSGMSDVTTNNSAETLGVQVEKLNGTIEVYGCCDLLSDEFFKITGFTLDFDIVDTISADGIYTFPIENIAKFKFKAMGSGEDTKVFCKMSKGV